MAENRTDGRDASQALVAVEGPRSETYIRLPALPPGSRGPGARRSVRPWPAWFEALLERNADELVLAHGRRPAFRIGRELHPVAKQELNGDQIQALLAELSATIGGDASAAGPGRFDYHFPDGRAFACEIAAGGPGSLSATLRPHRALDARPAAPSAAAPVAAGPASVQTIDDLLRRMVELGSSDLSSDEGPMVRIDGEMTRLPHGQPLRPEAVRRMLLGIMPQPNREEYERSHDTDFAYELAGVSRFRVNAFGDRKGPGGKRHGMQLMNDALAALVKQKVVDPDEAYRKSVDRAGLLAQLRVAGFHPTSVTET